MRKVLLARNGGLKRGTLIYSEAGLIREGGRCWRERIEGGHTNFRLENLRSFRLLRLDGPEEEGNAEDATSGEGEELSGRPP